MCHVITAQLARDGLGSVGSKGSGGQSIEVGHARHFAAAEEQLNPEIESRFSIM